MTTVDRPRLCDICGKIDTLPRHIQFDPTAGTSSPEFIREAIKNGATDDMIAEVMDTTTIIRHHECCAAQGCQVCLTVIDAAGGKIGVELAKAIQGGAVDHLSDGLNMLVVDNSAPPAVADHPDAVRLSQSEGGGA